jgi:hypothetical protein
MELDAGQAKDGVAGGMGCSYIAPPEPRVTTTSDRVEMLAALRRDGVLTAQEYEYALEILLHISASQ